MHIFLERPIFSYPPLHGTHRFPASRIVRITRPCKLYLHNGNARQLSLSTRLAATRDNKDFSDDVRSTNVIPAEGTVVKNLAQNVSDDLNGTNLYLVGMMGSGKTTVGSALAQSLNYLFLDTDTLIEQAAKCTIAEVFRSNGEKEFRAIESSVLRDVHSYKNLVLGTGGGIVTTPENWSYLHHGVIVFLDCDPEQLVERVTSDGLKERPMFFSEESLSDEEQAEIARKRLKELYTQRVGLYRSADITVSLVDADAPNGLASIDQVLTRILQQVKAKIQEAKDLREKQANDGIRGTATLPKSDVSINE